MKLIRFCIISVVVLWSAVASAATFGKIDVVTRDLPIDPDGTVWIDNVFGNVEVMGVDTRTVSMVAQRVVTGVDQNAVSEGQETTLIQFAGDSRNRAIQTVTPLMRSGRWTSTVNYTLRVPKTVGIRISSSSSERIRVANMGSPVRIKNINGAIVLEHLTGSVSADSVNGTITFESQVKPRVDVQLTTVNGNVELVMPPDAAFRWVATTLRGDVLANLPVRGRFVSTTFRGTVNGSRGPTITTAAMMGNIWLVRKGTPSNQARSVREQLAAAMPPAPPQAIVPRALQIADFEGPLTFTTALGNISVGQVRGSAKVETGAGEVHLGSVRGACSVVSLGGPLTFGDILGMLTARTRAGDVLVNAARGGAGISTGGGMIRIIYAGAAVNLHSEGGDVIVRQANGPVTADTRSGDISINMSPTLRGGAIDLRTAQGTVALGLSPLFAADIDATLVTSDPDINAIRSDFTGLTVRREETGGKTRIRATGKINGGGDRVVLYAEDGDIYLSFSPGVGVAPP